MRAIRNNMLFEELVGEDWVTEGHHLGGVNLSCYVTEQTPGIPT